MPAFQPPTAAKLLVLALGLCALSAHPLLPRQQSSRPEVASPAPDLATDLDRRLDESARAFTARDIARGLALLTEVRERAHEAGLLPQEAEALRRIAAADQSNGKTDAAAAGLGTALALFERAGDRAGQARTLLQRGTLLRQAGDIFRAIDLFKAAGDLDGLRRSYGTIVYVLPPGPELDRVRAEGFDAVRGAPTRDVECNLTHEWGDDLFNAGRFAESYTKLNAALACFAETTDRGREGRVLVSLGRLDRAHGRLQQALDRYVRALALQEQAHDEPAAIQSLNAIATTLGYLGREEEALTRYEEALRRAEAIHLPQINVLRGNVGGAYLQLGRYREAVQVLSDALAASIPAFVPVRHMQLAAAYRGLGELDRATESANKAVELSDEKQPQTLINALNARAVILIARRRFAEAAADLQSSIALIERLRANTVPTDYMKRGFSEAHQEVFAALIDSLQAQGKDRDALDTAERARSRAFLDLLATRSARGANETPAARTLESSGSAPPATVGDIVTAARRLNSTFLCYWVGASATSIWAVAPDGRIVPARVAVPAVRLAELVAEATGAGREAGAAEAIVSGAAGRRPWRELTRLLIDPVRAALPAAPGSRLTIVPHGVLFGLSFAGLRDKDGRYLIESHDLHYLPAAGVLAFTNTRRAAARSGSLLIGDPGELQGDVGAGTLAALPWARREVEAVRGLVEAPATLLVGAQAGEAAVRREVRGRSLVHFATHGIVRNDEALTSYLALRPDGAGADADGRLSADEVYALPLDADLVVLSACRTALGPTSGDGVIGFTRAFLSAGAASVVATMWDVPDRTTYEVMKTFYARRAAGRAKSRALRAAQLSVLGALRRGRLRAGDSVLPESPRLWAGFVLVGEPD